MKDNRTELQKVKSEIELKENEIKKMRKKVGAVAKSGKENQKEGEP